MFLMTVIIGWVLNSISVYFCIKHVTDILKLDITIDDLFPLIAAIVVPFAITGLLIMFKLENKCNIIIFKAKKD